MHINKKVIIVINVFLPFQNETELPCFSHIEFYIFRDIEFLLKIKCILILILLS